MKIEVKANNISNKEDVKNAEIMRDLLCYHFKNLDVEGQFSKLIKKKMSLNLKGREMSSKYFLMFFMRNYYPAL